MKKKIGFKTLEQTKRKDAYTMNPEIINVNHDENPRDDYGDKDTSFAELKESIRIYGNIMNPVGVFVDSDGIVHLGHGFRRMRAINELRAEGVPIEMIPVFEMSSNEENILIAHFTLNTGKPLSDLELGTTLNRLAILMGEDNWTEIAKRTGINALKVAKLVDFSRNAGTQIKTAVKEKKISLTNAVSLVKVTKKVEDQNKALDEAESLMIESGDSKIKIQHIKVLEAPAKIAPNVVTPEVQNESNDTVTSQLKNFVNVVLNTKNDELDFDFAKRLSSLITEIEDRNLTDKQIIGKFFQKETTEA